MGCRPAEYPKMCAHQARPHRLNCAEENTATRSRISAPSATSRWTRSDADEWAHIVKYDRETGALGEVLKPG